MFYIIFYLLSYTKFFFCACSSLLATTTPWFFSIKLVMKVLMFEQWVVVFCRSQLHYFIYAPIKINSWIHRWNSHPTICLISWEFPWDHHHKPFISWKKMCCFYRPSVGVVLSYRYAKIKLFKSIIIYLFN